MARPILVGKTLTMIPVPGRPGAWKPATRDDARALRSIERRRPGDLVGAGQNLVGSLVARAARAGVRVTFDPDGAPSPTPTSGQGNAL